MPHGEIVLSRIRKERFSWKISHVGSIILFFGLKGGRAGRSFNEMESFLCRVDYCKGIGNFD